MFLAYSFVVLIAHVYRADCADFLTSYIKPCSYKDSEDVIATCIKHNIEIALPLFSKGIPELGVPSLDPIKFDDIILDGNGLKLALTEVSMLGLSGSKLNHVKINLEKKDAKFTLGVKVDLNITAKYDVDGRVIILPIQGKGDAIIQTKGVAVTIDSKLTNVKDDKGDHFRIVHPSYNYTIEKTTFHFENLFNGNKLLSDSTHQFANENWQQLIDELAPPVFNQNTKTIIKAINKFFASVTIDQITRDYDGSA